MCVQQRDNLSIQLTSNLLISSLILIYLSGNSYFGVTNSLVIALLLPVLFFFYQIFMFRAFSFVSVVVFLHTAVTAMIVFLNLDIHWLAIKEVFIPALLAMFLLSTNCLKHSRLIKVFFNQNQFDVELLNKLIYENGNVKQFKKMMVKSNWVVSISLTISAVINYVLIKFNVTSPVGTKEFNIQLGEMLLLNYLLITLSFTIVSLGVLIYVEKITSKLTGCHISLLFKQ